MGLSRVEREFEGNERFDVRRRLGYLPESAPLYEDMGVIDYLEYVAEMRGFSLPAEYQSMSSRMFA